MPILAQLKSAWNAFKSQQDLMGQTLNETYMTTSTPTYGTTPPTRTRKRFYNERSIISSVYTRIAIDTAGIPIKHVQLDSKNFRYSGDMDSALNTCLTLEPNMDQGPRQFRQDIALTLFDRGVAAIVPVDMSTDPNDTTGMPDIYTLRVGEIVAWYPKHVRVSLYNEDKGIREEVTLEKSFIAIVENPLYGVMNEPNSTLQRLVRKLHLLDDVDEQSGSGKLDIIIQLPYVIKSAARQEQAEKRRKDIEFQLKDSQYGIAYTDGTEKITQLNRPTENNLMDQVKYLSEKLYGELGITEEIMNGTADEATMINYHNRTIEPLLDAITESMQRAFLGRIGTQKKQMIRYFRDPFKFVPLADIAEIADKFTRNEVLSSNELRDFMGIIPSTDPKADQLNNSNMPQPALMPGQPALPPAQPALPPAQTQSSNP